MLKPRCGVRVCEESLFSRIEVEVVVVNSIQLQWKDLVHHAYSMCRSTWKCTEFTECTQEVLLLQIRVN